MVDEKNEKNEKKTNPKTKTKPRTSLVISKCRRCGGSGAIDCDKCLNGMKDGHVCSWCEGMRACDCPDCRGGGVVAVTLTTSTKELDKIINE